MQLVYVQFWRFGFFIPFLFIGACVAAGYTRDWFHIGSADHFGFASLASALFAAFSALLRLSINGIPAQKVYMELDEEWIVTKEVDQFMYLSLKQWSGCGIGGMLAFLVLRFI